jgi:glycosyltransferase involved in cell wall biosynthesis
MLKVDMLPTLTVVTVVRNAVKTIGMAMDSVKAQTYPRLQYIIIDGDSSDGTREYIASRISDVNQFISEPDGGLYDAMNKSINIVSSGYLLFLNADDQLHSSNSIDCLMNGVNPKNPRQEIYYGSVMMVRAAGGGNKKWTRRNINRLSLFRGPPPHPATVVDRRVFDKVGLFDTTYSLAADYEWYLRAFHRCDCSFHRVDTIVTDFSCNGLTSSAKMAGLLERENEEIRQKYYSCIERFVYPGLLRRGHLLRRSGLVRNTD